MSVIQNQTPETRKPPRRYRDWLLMTAALALLWLGLCELVQWLIAR